MSVPGTQLFIVEHQVLRLSVKCFVKTSRRYEESEKPPCRAPTADSCSPQAPTLPQDWSKGNSDVPDSATLRRAGCVSWEQAVCLPVLPTERKYTLFGVDR